MLIVIAAWVAALLVFAAFFMKTMIPLRLVAIASNAAFVAYALLGVRYGIFGSVYPILVLHAALLPLNVVRLREIRRLIDAVNAASRTETFEHLIPFMTSEQHRDGSTVFSKGDRADKLFFIEHGTILFPELGRRLATGGFFGEVGLFAPHGVRSASAVCEGECRLYGITRDKVLELYHQDPEFGFFLIRMVSALVQEDDRQRSGPSPERRG